MTEFEGPMKTTELSPTMQRAVRLAMDSGGKLIRYPGGYWRGGGAGHVGTSTVEALVKRGVGSYSAWKESRRGKFPIELTLHCDGAGVMGASDSTLVLKVGRCYRAKKPACVRGLFNDRQITWMGPSTVQYDGPSVSLGSRLPRVTHEQFLKWAGEDVTDKLPPGEWEDWTR